jgi:hypothetical protein
MKSKLFGIGLSRTGTSSLTAALSRLGYSGVHWPSDPLTQYQLLTYLRGDSDGFMLTAADRYDVLTDTPIACVYRELSIAYPDSRFILTTRDEEPWLRSCAAFWSRPRFSHRPEFGDYCVAVNTHLYGRPDFEATSFRAAYANHTARVKWI